MNNPNKAQRELLALQKEMADCRSKLQVLLQRAEALTQEDVSLLNQKGRNDFKDRYDSVMAEINTAQEELKTLMIEIDGALGSDKP